jgi:hypothetical protein
MNQKRRGPRRRRTKEDIKKFAEELAPLEERRKQSFNQTKTQQNGGAIVVDSRSVNLPAGVETEHETKSGIEGVVLIILGLMLAYIAFIAWQISQTPPK